jgi:hypothetical protein
MANKAREIKEWLIVGLVLALLCPFPTKIAQPLTLKFFGGDSRLLAGLRVSQSWESYGLFGSGRDEVVVDHSGVVTFPARSAYGTVATRTLARAFSLIAVHTSYGARVTIEFTLPAPSEVSFVPPTFSPLQPFATSGSYLDADGRVYFPQVSPRGQRVMVSGEFASGGATLHFPIKEN